MKHDENNPRTEDGTRPDPRGPRPLEDRKVIRYVVTHVPKGDMRTLVDPCQGRFTYATREEAQERLDAIRDNNTPERLRSVGLEPDTFEVRPCSCWAGHFDPVGVFFSEPGTIFE